MRSFERVLLRFERAFERTTTAVASSVVLFAFIFVLDLITNAELAFSLFYVIPIALLVWFVNVPAAAVASLIGTLLGLSLDLRSDVVPSHSIVPFWSALSSIALYVATILVLAALRSALRREQGLARTDALTGVSNHRHFREIAEMELTRSARYKHPFTVVYIDVDDFKDLNDRLGHVVGDEVLKGIASAIHETARTSDVVARLGGDEFGVLLPETENEGTARFLVRLKTHLFAILERFEFTVTVSVGAVTFMQVPASVDAMIAAADEVMYEVKRAGKNDIRQRVVGEALQLDGRYATTRGPLG